MPEHTAPPYRIGGGGNLIAKDDGDEFTIAFVRASPWGDNSHDALLANAEFIVTACNAHDALVEAAEAVLDLGIWAMSEQDYGATVLSPEGETVFAALRAAIEQAQP